MKKSHKLFTSLEDRQKAFISVLIGAFLGGAVTTVTKIGLISIPPLTFAFLRFTIASLIVLPLFIGKYGFSIKKIKELAPFSLFATFNIIVFVLGIRTTTATIGQLLYAAVPFLTGFIMFILFGSKLTKRKIYGIIVGFIGVGIVVLLPVMEHGKQFSGDIKGNLLIGAGVVSWSLYMVFSRKFSKIHDPFLINSAFIFITSLVLFPLFIIEVSTNNSWIQYINWSSILSIGYVAVFGTVLNYLLNQFAIKHGGSVFASMSFYLLPIFAFISAFVLLGEGLTPGLILGGILALFGIFLVTSK